MSSSEGNVWLAERIREQKIEEKLQLHAQVLEQASQGSRVGRSRTREKSPGTKEMENHGERG